MFSNGEEPHGRKKSRIRLPEVSNDAGGAGNYAAHEPDLVASLSQITLLSALVYTYGVYPEHADGAVWEEEMLQGRV
ncbi:hypothetical protein SLS64_012584 [Diaporthe eres]